MGWVLLTWSYNFIGDTALMHPIKYESLLELLIGDYISIVIATNRSTVLLSFHDDDIISFVPRRFYFDSVN